MVKSNNGLQKYKMDELRSDVDKLQNDMTLMLTNHLPHLREDTLNLKSEILSLKTRINVMTAINTGGIILALIAGKFLR